VYPAEHVQGKPPAIAASGSDPGETRAPDIITSAFFLLPSAFSPQAKKSALHRLELAKAIEIHARPTIFSAVMRTRQISLYESTTMSALTDEKCIACRRDAPRATEAEISELKSQIPEWALVEREGIQRLERVFRFTNFADALNFTNRVGALAEEEGHHPAILTEWGRVTVTLWTHKIRGLHRNDFIMAAKLDSL
jgi:4a-hydroxytetrahydrobiopterin dehydratase